MTNLIVMHSKNDPVRRRHTFKLAVLRHWLQQPIWTSSEAAHILAGVDPETPIHSAVSASREVQLRLLPGSPKPRDPWEWLDLASTLEERIHRLDQYVSQMKGLATLKPKLLIERASRRGVQPPWIEAATRDAVCKSLLPLTLPNNRQNFFDSQRSKALKKNADEHGPLRAAIYAKLEASAGNFPKECFTKGDLTRNRPRRLRAAKIVRWLADQIDTRKRPGHQEYDDTTVQRHVRHWLASHPLVES
ncbi:hypothetical protein [Aurantimonas sp. A3-2-R12]|uniref:hypothetical protein n=1 Tax=Aurantimonas sp. A3-2-R12 TaxID=3114362 RepID=UPI002E17B6E0|nr:hypothetical protein [Aurantimonas sp. A3-2-R12]